jgi:hypothetical protein
MEYEVRCVKDRHGMKDFLRLPYAVYRNNPHWVPPIEAEVRRVLNPDRNPYFIKATLDLMVCYRSGAAVARMCLVINEEFCRVHGERTAFFGFFESVDDPVAVRALFGRADEICATRDIGILEGPFNPHHYAELGMLADCYDEDQAFFETYNPPYYHALLKSSDSVPCVTLSTGRNPDLSVFLHSSKGSGMTAGGTGPYSTRKFSLRDMDRDLEAVREVFNDAFAENWHFLPTTADEQRFSAKYLRAVTEPDLITIVEHHGNPVGVLMCALDVNPLLRRMHGRMGVLGGLRFLRDRKRIRTLVVYAVGIRRDYQRTRVFAILLDSMRDMARRYDTLTCTWMSPSNPLAIAASQRMGLREHKHFLIYRRPCAGKSAVS